MANVRWSMPHLTRARYSDDIPPVLPPFAHRIPPEAPFSYHLAGASCNQGRAQSAPVPATRRRMLSPASLPDEAQRQDQAIQDHALVIQDHEVVLQDHELMLQDHEVVLHDHELMVEKSTLKVPVHVTCPATTTSWSPTTRSWSATTTSWSRTSRSRSRTTRP